MKTFIFSLFLMSLPIIMISQIELENTIQYDSPDVFTQFNPESTYKLDSLYYYTGDYDNWKLNFRGKAVKFNSIGKSLEVIYHFWDSENETWIKKDSLSLLYYTPDKIKQALRLFWNSDINQWQDTSYYSRYDDNNNRLVSKFKKWDYKQNKLLSGYSYKYSYKNSLQTSKLIQKLDTAYNMWSNYTKQTFSYNDKELNDTSYLQVWTSYFWSVFLKTIKEYDNSDLLIQSLDLKYNSGISDNYQKTSYKYDDYGNRIEYTIEKWQDSIWIPSTKQLFVYDQNNNRTVRTVLKFSDNKWNNTVKYTYSYDSKNQQIEVKTDIWDVEINEWIQSRQETTVYDDFGNVVLRESKNKNPDLNTWENESKVVYYYSEIDTDSNKPANKHDLNIFPNPTTGFISIKNTQVINATLYNASGNIIKCFNAPSIIDISDQPNGIYLLEIITNNQLITKRIFKL